MVDPTLYLYTSLTAGSSHIITATSRLETILKANRIPFRAIDCATDEKARQLWGRRSKGRKIPGLVKYGQVIGDLEQVEEWNEFGELKMQVDSVSDLFGDTPMTDNPMEPPVNTIPPSALKPIVEKSSPSISRSSSETRHISISEPKDREKESSHPAAALKKDGTPLAIAMRQAGAEAAAKAGQKKSSTASCTKPSSIDVENVETNSTSKRDSTDTTPSPMAFKQLSDAAVDPHDSQTTAAVTDAKTPAQLTAEGSVRPGQLEKNAEQSASNTSTESFGHLGQDLSNQEQVLDMRRRSSVVKSTSRLAEGTTVTDADQAEQSTDEALTKTHRGSSVTEVPQEIAKQVEQENVIKEEPDKAEARDVKDETPSREAAVGATEEAEKKVTKGRNPQDGVAGEADEASVSVGD